MAGEGVVKYGEVYRDRQDGEKVMFVAESFPENHVIRLSIEDADGETPYEDTMLTTRRWGAEWERVDE